VPGAYSPRLCTASLRFTDRRNVHAEQLSNGRGGSGPEALQIRTSPFDFGLHAGQTYRMASPMPRQPRVIAHIDSDCFYAQVEHRRLNIPRDKVSP
jgi:hypothetical protein